MERKIEGAREQTIISYQRVRFPPLRADPADFVSAYSGRAAAAVEAVENADTRIVSRELPAGEDVPEPASRKAATRSRFAERWVKAEQVELRGMYEKSVG